MTLDYLSNQASPNLLNLNNNNIIKNSNSFNSDIKFITRYAKYLHTRVKQFESTGWIMLEMKDQITIPISKVVD